MNLKVKSKRENSAFSRRHFFWRVLTIILFVYLCANVSVLEYFGGNLSLGIASYRQVVEINPQSAKTSRTAFARNTIDASRSSKHDQETEIPWDGDDCFCFSSHALIGGANLIVLLIPVVQQQRAPIFSNRQNHSDWQLPTFYRPPRIA